MKIGVIGLGSIGMRHANNLASLGHEVIGYDPILVSKYPAFDPWKDRSPEAFVIASPTDTHLDFMAYLALQDKPIFVEKPIAHKALKEYGRTTRVRTDMVGYNMRFHPAVIMAKRRMLDIGQPIWANFVCAQKNNKPVYLRDGVILNWSHEIDLALYLLGEADVVASHTRLTDDKDDMTDIVLKHGNFCRTTVHLDYLTEPEQRYFTIVGTGGTIAVDLPNRTFRFTEPDGFYEETQFEGTYDDDYLTEMKAFIARCHGGAVPGCTKPEALAVLDVCLQVRKDAGL